MFVSLYVCFMMLWVIFSIYALLFSLHRVCVLDMHTSLCYYVSLNACSDDHLLCYVIIVVISIWLFLVYDQVAHMFHIIFTWSQFTYYIILVLLLLALPWVSNVFCASVSGHRYLCFKFITAPMTRDRGSDMIREVFIFVLWVLYLCLCPCYFCKLLGFVFIFCRLYDLYHALCSLYALLN